MIPAAFDYVAPSTVEEAVRVLAEAGEDAKVLAGGQSLLPVLRVRLAEPSTVVDLGRIAELRGVREDGDAIVIGAMTTHYDVMRDELVRQHAGLLAEATGTVATRRSATAARSEARSRTPTRQATCSRRCSPWTRNC